MFFADIHARDFIELLGGLPSSPATTRAHILGAFGVLVTGDDPVGWWDALTRDRGEEGAANAVAQLVISKGGKRVFTMIKADAAGRSNTPRADDSKLVRLLFDDAMEDSLYDQWGLQYGVCAYFKETQEFLEDDDPDLPEPEDDYRPDDLEEDEEDAENGPSIFDLFSGKPRPSAQRGAHWTLELPDRWRERDLEEFPWSNWESIDFGCDRPIYLVGKQERLSDSDSGRCRGSPCVRTGPGDRPCG